MQSQTRHDCDACRDLDCTACFPEYVPQVGDCVEDARGNVWRVTSTCTPNGKIQLQHTPLGHYADAPRTQTGGFAFPFFTKVNTPA
ncbi:hypothetical protein ACFW6E_08960 [Streptomyces olivaceoviridis]|uniref:hypothetical protein n=1 Tax=Streptomyces olivaceoviridis TaxID=1921 RepID=UPI00369C0273